MLSQSIQVSPPCRATILPSSSLGIRKDFHTTVYFKLNEVALTALVVIGNRHFDISSNDIWLSVSFYDKGNPHNFLKSNEKRIEIFNMIKENMLSLKCQICRDSYRSFLLLVQDK